MKAPLSLVAALALTALAIGVPTALAEGRLAGSPELFVSSPPDWAERAAALNTSPDWFERAAAGAARANIAVSSYRDAFERAAVPVEPLAVPVTVAATGSDSSNELVQVGVAFAAGLVLALFLMAAVRVRPRRSLA